MQEVWGRNTVSPLLLHLGTRGDEWSTLLPPPHREKNHGSSSRKNTCNTKWAMSEIETNLLKARTRQHGTEYLSTVRLYRQVRKQSAKNRHYRTTTSAHRTGMLIQNSLLRELRSKDRRNVLLQPARTTRRQTCSDTWTLMCSSLIGHVTNWTAADNSTRQ